MTGEAAELQALQEVATDLLSHLDLEGTLLSIINAAVNLIDAEIAGILLVDDDDKEILKMQACTGHRTVETAHLKVRSGQGVAGKVFQIRQPFKVDDYLSSSSISREFFGIAQEEGTRSALGAPMIFRDEVIGTLMVWRRRPSLFADADIRTISTLANFATIAIVNARLFETERSSVRALQEANRRLEDQYRLLQRSADVHDELTRLVLEGNAISDLTTTVGRHTDGDVVVMDTDLTVLAKSWNTDAVVARAKRYLEKAKGSHKDSEATSILPPDHMHDGYLIVRDVAAGGELIGYLCISLNHSPDRFNTVIVEQAAVVCALQLTRERAVLEARTRAHEDFLWDLLEGNIADEAEAVAGARHLGYKLPDSLRVMVIAVEGVDEWARATGGAAEAVERRRESLVRSAERLAATAGVHGLLAARRGWVVALMLPALEDAKRARALAQTILQGLQDEFAPLSFSAGLSSCVPLSADLSQAYAQAQHALSAVARVATGAPVGIFDELGVIRFLLAPGDREDLSKFVGEVLGPAIEYDRAHAGELVHTVEAYLASDCSLQRTADRLYVHPKTVRYRLNRLEDLTKIDLDRQRDRFDAQLAIAVMHVLSVQGAKQ
jgi:sugar diacid utilization regulator/putative methionine-R-sulfoxide reductase with GAF domain